MGIHEKGWGDVVSAVCVQRDRYIVYIVQQTAETTSPKLLDPDLIVVRPNNNKLSVTSLRFFTQK